MIFNIFIINNDHPNGLINICTILNNCNNTHRTALTTEILKSLVTEI